MPTKQTEIEHYLATGGHDHLYGAWSGHGLPARARHGNAELRAALLAEVKWRTAHATVPVALAELDLVAFTRSKVEPMVRGLFTAADQPPVLALLARSVVFLTPTNIESELNRQTILGTSWHLANLYLASCAAPLLSGEAPQIVGLSDATTCYVSTVYFTPTHRLDDFLVHEAAHVLHNCKRATIGLSQTRRREWLLDIAFGKRETFAYACEAYSRILELADSPAARRNLLAEAGPPPPDERVDGDEYLDILRQAVAARNGWKRILTRCAPVPR